VPTLAIVDPRSSIGTLYRDRLRLASRVLEGVKNNEDAIVSFALAGIAEPPSTRAVAHAGRLGGPVS
jgi:hypothetical protein